MKRFPNFIALEAKLIDGCVIISLVDLQHGEVLDCRDYHGQVTLANVDKWVADFKDSLEEHGVM